VQPAGSRSCCTSNLSNAPRSTDVAMLHRINNQNAHHNLELGSTSPYTTNRSHATRSSVFDAPATSHATAQQVLNALQALPITLPRRWRLVLWPDCATCHSRLRHQQNKASRAPCPAATQPHHERALGRSLSSSQSCSCRQPAALLPGPGFGATRAHAGCMQPGRPPGQQNTAQAAAETVSPPQTQLAVCRQPTPLPIPRTRDSQPACCDELCCPDAQRTLPSAPREKQCNPVGVV